eukprot:scaffold3874_cov18-Tisochrysis_lutea.AAC.1
MFSGTQLLCPVLGAFLYSKRPSMATRNEPSSPLLKASQQRHRAVLCLLMNILSMLGVSIRGLMLSILPHKTAVGSIGCVVEPDSGDLGLFQEALLLWSASLGDSLRICHWGSVASVMLLLEKHAPGAAVVAGVRKRLQSCHCKLELYPLGSAEAPKT